MRSYLIVAILITAAACKSLEFGGGPGKGRHRITIEQLALSDSDFTMSALGNPKEIELYASRDGARVPVSRIEGFRGPRNLKLSFELDYDPKSRYEFVLEEVSIVTQGKRWNISSQNPGSWPFDRRVNFGAGSSIVFADEKVN